MAHDDDNDSARAALLAAYRRRAEPPPGAADRGWAGLQSRIARGEQGPLAAADDPPTPAPRRPWLLALAAAAAVLIAVGLSYGTARHGSLAAAFAAVFGRPPAPPADATIPAPSLTPPAPSDMPVAPGPSGQVEGALARELALVRAADAAVRAGDGPAALERADTYLRSHPAGTFAPEARLHRAAALCLLGRGDEARRAAAEFARDYPTSPLRARVAAVCSETPSQKNP